MKDRNQKGSINFYLKSKAGWLLDRVSNFCKFARYLGRFSLIFWYFKKNFIHVFDGFHRFHTRLH